MIPEEKILKNCFKPFMISQNVKKFANKLMQRILYYRKVNALHFQVINDKASSFNKDVKKESEEGAMVHFPSKKHQKDNCLDAITRGLKRVALQCDKACCKKGRSDAMQRLEEVLARVPVIQPESKVSLGVSVVISVI